MTRLTLLAEVSIPAVPPSVNHYTINKRGGGVTLSDEAREFKSIAYQSLIAKAPCRASEKRIAVEVTIYPKDKRKSDIDNRNKLILDALENAGYFVNDNQIDELLTKRGKEIIPGGRVDLIVCEMED